MDLTEEMKTATSRNKCNPEVHSKCLSLHPHVRVAIIPHQNFSLQQTNTTPESYNQSKYRVTEPNPNGDTYKTALYLRFRKHQGRNGRKSVRARGSWSWLRDCVSKEWVFAEQDRSSGHQAPLPCHHLLGLCHNLPWRPVWRTEMRARWCTATVVLSQVLPP